MDTCSECRGNGGTHEIDLVPYGSTYVERRYWAECEYCDGSGTLDGDDCDD